LRPCSRNHNKRSLPRFQAAPKAKAAPKAAAAPKATKAPAKKAATSKKTTTTKGKSAILADLDENAQGSGSDDQDSDAMQIDSEFEEAAPKAKSKKGPVAGAAAKQNKSASETYQKVVVHHSERLMSSLCCV
jgi:hypothetical protein